jgi:hypothetical protein
LLLLAGCICPADDGFSGEPPGSEPGASASPPKAPLQAVSEKNSIPKNTRRIVDCPKVAFGVLLAGILVENTGCSISDQSPHNEDPSNIPNNMKGRALSFENHTDFRSMDPAMTIAWAFKRSALSHSAAPAPCTSLPNAPPNGETRFKSSKSGELNGPQGRHLTQPLIHHHKALPIFAAFGLRYIHILVRKWAALGM